MAIPGKIIDLKALPTDFYEAEYYAPALLDRDNQPEALQAITAEMVNAPALVFIVPEYNGSMPGVLKGFIDSLPYPAAFSGKAVGLVGLSKGGMGGALALSHLTDVFNYLGATVVPMKPRLAAVHREWTGVTGFIASPAAALIRIQLAQLGRQADLFMDR